ncbi:MAG: pyridoxamine 5'-phosphate oxidase family protein [Planctomycetota bacterium]|nr:pyridoxamine 5'-phosphate oxidase family protein [Planctomycetota bacterium]
MSQPSTDRTRVRRIPDRARYDKSDVLAILREGLVAHVALVDPERGPVVLPMVYGVDEVHLYLHGSPASRLVRQLMSGADCCVEVTLLDELVIARSVFHHSMNYRSAMVHGQPENLEDHAAKNAALKVIVEHVVPGQWGLARVPSPAELDQTAVVRLPLTEAVAKVRTGDPVDEPEDTGLPIWAGRLLRETRWSAPIDAEDLGPGLSAPEHLRSYGR